MTSAARQYAQAGAEAGGPGTAPDPIGPVDWRRLAALHCGSLPGSAIAALGEPYAERFYHYLADSARERAFVHRDATGAIDAACVLSLDPSSLNRRLWFSTPLPWALMRTSGAGGRRTLVSALSPLPAAHRYESGDGASLVIDAPEVVLVFVAPGRRRRGLGRALIVRGRAWLWEAGYRRCLARTRDHPRNRAVDFYRAVGFELRGRSSRRGFQVWESAV